MGLPILLLCILISARALAAVAGVPPAAAAQESGGREPTFSWIPREAPVPTWISAGAVTGFIGQRRLGGEGWRHLPPAFQLGVEVTAGPRRWWLQPVVAYQHASATGEYHGDGISELNLAFLGTYREDQARGQLTTDVDELDLGVRRDWRWGPVRLAGAAGAGWVRVAMEDRPASTPFRTFALTDTSPRQAQAQTFAGWSALSLGLDCDRARVGITARYTYAPVQVFGQDLQAGGLQLGAHLGWEW